MTLDPDKVAERLGATFKQPSPISDAGAFGMAALAEKMKHRLDARGREHGSAIGWVLGSRVPISIETEKLLINLAEKMSTPHQRVNPLQLAAQLLEESVHRLTNETTT